MERRVSDPATPDVDLVDVRAFCRVVDLGSMTAAAKSLGETKGTMSRRIARLERAVGLPLVNRTGRRVVPTDEGLTYRQKAGLAVEQLDEALSVVREGRGRPAGHLRITAPIGFGTLFLGPILGPFTEAFPDVTTELLMTDAVLSFGQDRIDVALRLGSRLPDSSLVAHKLFDLRAWLVASPDYVARHGEPSSPDAFASHRFLIPPTRGPSSIALAFAPTDGSRDPEEVVVQGHVMSHDMLVLREAALGGAGIAFMPTELARREVEAGRLVEVMTAWRIALPVALYLVTAGGRLPPKTLAFRDFVRDYWRESARAEAPGCPG